MRDEPDVQHLSEKLSPARSFEHNHNSRTARRESTQTQHSAPFLKGRRRAQGYPERRGSPEKALQNLPQILHVVFTYLQTFGPNVAVAIPIGASRAAVSPHFPKSGDKLPLDTELFS